MEEVFNDSCREIILVLVVHKKISPSSIYSTPVSFWTKHFCLDHYSQARIGPASTRLSYCLGSPGTTPSPSESFYPTRLIAWICFKCCPLQPLPPTLTRNGMQSENHKYWITVKGGPSLIRCHSLLRPWWMGSERHLLFYYLSVLPPLKTAQV